MGSSQLMITLETGTPVAKQCSCKPDATIVRRGNFQLASHNQVNGETGRKLQNPGSSQTSWQAGKWLLLGGGWRKVPGRECMKGWCEGAMARLRESVPGNAREM